MATMTLPVAVGRVIAMLPVRWMAHVTRTRPTANAPAGPTLSPLPATHPSQATSFVALTKHSLRQRRQCSHRCTQLVPPHFISTLYIFSSIIFLFLLCSFLLVRIYALHMKYYDKYKDFSLLLPPLQNNCYLSYLLPSLLGYHNCSPTCRLNPCTIHRVWANFTPPNGGWAQSDI